jgi:hypothetical protein
MGRKRGIEKRRKKKDLRGFWNYSLGFSGIF